VVLSGERKRKEADEQNEGTEDSEHRTFRLADVGEMRGGRSALRGESWAAVGATRGRVLTPVVKNQTTVNCATR
jgi:hypothetical protein